ncbi:hypothetical protein HY572_02320 [Candidatus Micrarchaeota archaeon]|nr:hypothetical protein [Candidatus Micrarchaeota archaeon]
MSSTLHRVFLREMRRHVAPEPDPSDPFIHSVAGEDSKVHVCNPHLEGELDVPGLRHQETHLLGLLRKGRRIRVVVGLLEKHRAVLANGGHYVALFHDAGTRRVRFEILSPVERRAEHAALFAQWGAPAVKPSFWERFKRLLGF